MTLEKCDGFFHFMFKRWLRLFPAMLICTGLIYLTSGFFFERPNGVVNVKDLIPGLLFVEPYYISKIIGPVTSLESAFWSLYVEFKFYIISAFFYFLFGGRNLVYILFTLFLMWFISFIAQGYTDNKIVYLFYSISTHLSLKYFGWFAAGSAYYFYTKTQDKYWFFFALFICICSSAALAMEKSSLAVFIAIAFICAFFAFSLISSKLQSLLSNKCLVFMGYISYPLYLMHENMMISFIIKFQSLVPDSILFFLPILAIALISYAAFIVAKYIERPVKLFIEYIFSFKKIKIRSGC